MPAGNETITLRSFSTAPAPLQAVQGVFTTLPSPLHSGQVWVNITNPREVETCPTPPQVPHCLRLVPGLAPVPEHSSQATGVRMGTSRLQPSMASLNVRRCWTRMSCPRAGPPRRRWPPTPPKNSEKMSWKCEKMSPPSAAAMPSRPA